MSGSFDKDAIRRRISLEAIGGIYAHVYAIEGTCRLMGVVDWHESMSNFNLSQMPSSIRL
jgi:hypothetical protein